MKCVTNAVAIFVLTFQQYSGKCFHLCKKNGAFVNDGIKNVATTYWLTEMLTKLSTRHKNPSKFHLKIEYETR